MTPSQLLDACRQSAKTLRTFDDVFRAQVQAMKRFVARVQAILILESMELMPAVFTEYEAAIIRTLDLAKAKVTR